jgi:hypothetical protein
MPITIASFRSEEPVEVVKVVARARGSRRMIGLARNGYWCFSFDAAATWACSWIWTRRQG